MDPDNQAIYFKMEVTTGGKQNPSGSVARQETGCYVF